MCVYIYIYIYIYTVCIYVCIYIYIYIYIWGWRVHVQQPVGEDVGDTAWRLALPFQHRFRPVSLSLPLFLSPPTSFCWLLMEIVDLSRWISIDEAEPDRSISLHSILQHALSGGPYPGWPVAPPPTPLHIVLYYITLHYIYITICVYIHI